MEKQETMELCKDHLHRYVMVKMMDQSEFDGIVAGISSEYLILAEPIGQAAAAEHRAFGFYPPGGYMVGYGPYGLGYGGYYGYGMPLRFRRRVLPLAGLLGLSLLPYFW